jgi:GntR family transcriptional regulator
MVLARSNRLGRAAGSHVVWDVSSLPYLTPRAAGEADAWSLEASAAGRAGSQVIREAGLHAPSAEITSALQLTPGEQAVVRRRTMLLDGRPVELTDSWYPAQVAAGTPLAGTGKIRGGAVTLLAAMGYAVHEALEDISVRPATAGEAVLLEIPAGSALIILSRTCLNAAAVPFEASIAVMPADGRHLRYRLTASAT